MKTILLLGGSAQQVVAIKKAKELGYRTVLCDYLPDNPGKDVADVFYLVSTTDKEAVLGVAVKEHIDGIVAYASDPAALTAAYVAEELGLPGHPYKSVEILTNKDLFREFMKAHGFFTPKAKGFDSYESFKEGLLQFSLPVFIKPVDSSGSKGIALIESDEQVHDDELLQRLFVDALSYSRAKRVIVEEFVKKKGYQVAGDGFSINGKLAFRCFGDDHFDPGNPNPFVPVSASFPSGFSMEIQQKIHNEIQRLLTLLDMRTGAYNFDILVEENNNIFLMEIGPRNGGNYIPLLVEQATGFDIVGATLQAAVNDPIEISLKQADKYVCYYALHSKKNGRLSALSYDEKLQKNLIASYLNYSIGDNVSKFTGASSTLGIILCEFDSMEKMLDRINRLHEEDGLNMEITDESN